MAEPVIGIDLGTTNSCVCVYWKDRYQVIPNSFGNSTTPSYVTFSTHDIQIGEASRDDSFNCPENAIFGIKRIIGRRFEDVEVQKNKEIWPFAVIDRDGYPAIQVQQGGRQKTYSPAEISSHILKHLRKSVENYTGKDITKAVITVPASFTDAQRRATMEAAKLAGLNVIGMINEPTAAAMAYGLQKLEKKQTVLVFDFGGGTLDIAIMEVTDSSNFESMAIASAMNLGGEDFDEKLLDRFVEVFEQTNGGINLRDDPKAFTLLRLRCDRVKKSLSQRNGQAHVAIPRIHGTKDFNASVARAEFETMCADVFAKILEPVERALKQANLRERDIDHVVLAGGSSRMPKVQEILQNFFKGKTLHRDINGDEAIAHGAVVYARLLTADESHPMTNEDGEVTAIVLIEKTAHSLGVDALDLGDDTMSVVVPKGSRVPFKKHRPYTTVVNNQKTIVWNIYEGESKNAWENNLLGTFKLSNIQPAPGGTPKLELEFASDSFGCVKVTAKDKGSGNICAITVDYN